MRRRGGQWGVVFRTKPQLAIDIIAEVIAENTMPPWCAGEEVYGRCTQLRRYLEEHDVGYVLRVRCAFGVQPGGHTARRLFNLVTHQIQTMAHHLHWIWCRRRHQARAIGLAVRPVGDGLDVGDDLPSGNEDSEVNISLDRGSSGVRGSRRCLIRPTVG